MAPAQGHEDRHRFLAAAALLDSVFSYDGRRDLIEACSRAAHEAWLDEKTRRIRQLQSEDLSAGRSPRRLSWPSETGEEQLVPWDSLSEPVRDFDRIVVGAIVAVMDQRRLLR
jgi:hypothetical protein